MALLLVFVRILRRWNQTGQKFVGSPDIVHSDFLRNPIILWLIIGLTYALPVYSLKQHLCRYLPPEVGILGIFLAVALGSTGLLFKLSFTARDAPELVLATKSAMAGLEGLSLVKLARAVFFGIFVSTCWLIVQDRVNTEDDKRRARRVKRKFVIR